MKQNNYGYPDKNIKQFLEKGLDKFFTLIPANEVIKTMEQSEREIYEIRTDEGTESICIDNIKDCNDLLNNIAHYVVYGFEKKRITKLFVTAKEWFDKVNGNSYFSARIQVNNETIYLPFQDGYDWHYIQQAGEALRAANYILGDNYDIRRYCREENINASFQKIENCLKRDVKEWGRAEYTAPLFHNATLQEHAQKNRYEGALYAYEIEPIESGGYSLEIHSTSLSELDDAQDDAGILETYSYQTKKEIKQDIKAFTELTKIDLNKL